MQFACLAMTNESKIIYLLSSLNIKRGDNEKIKWLKERFKNVYSRKVLIEINENEKRWKIKVDAMTKKERRDELISLL